MDRAISAQSDAVVVDDPLGAASARLTMGRCSRLAISFRTFDGEFADTWIDENNVAEGWMNPLGTWIGADPAPMIQALEATWAARSTDGDLIWVIVERNGRLEGRQFVATTTPRGRELWYVKDSLTACSAEASPRPTDRSRWSYWTIPGEPSR